MDELANLLRDLVIANRILAYHGVLDAFGHVSFRHPDNPQHYFMSCSRGPGNVTRDDLLEFNLESEPIDQRGRAMYAERQIHGRAYQARPDVMSVCHNHSAATIPFGVSDVPLKPIFHMGSVIGHQVPVWDIADEFGPTNLLVTTPAAGASLAKTLGDGRVVLMRGHGATVVGHSLREVVFTSVYMQRNAEMATAARNFTNVRFLGDEEIDLASELLFQPLSQDRAWDDWTKRLGPLEDV
jgi:ribulose-5-phosphate 4-epimerase/fuculose-1-phosphate aldolase